MVVQRELDILVDTIRSSEIFSEKDIYLLYGSYGKGEGIVINNSPRNDYDIFVLNVSGKVTREKLVALTSDLAINKIDWLVNNNGDYFPISQQSFDMKKHVVLLGKSIPLNILPYEIPYTDAISSIEKRIVSLILGKYEMKKDSPDYRKVAEQIIKAIIAIGDATLIRRGEFHPSYFVRALMLEFDGIGEMYRMAVRIKCIGDPVLDPDQLWALWNQTRDIVRDYCLENSIGGAHLDTLIQIDEDTTFENLGNVLVDMGAGDWL